MKRLGIEQPGLLYAAFAFSQGIGLISYWTLPVVYGALVSDLGLSATKAGFIGTIEFLGLLLASLVVTPFVASGRKRLAVIAVALVLAANLVTWLVGLEYTALAAVRFVAGLGAGLALAVGNATIANAKDAERFSGLLTIVLVAFMVVLIPILSRVSAAHGYAGVCAGLAVTVLIGAGSWIFLPDAAVDTTPSQSADGGGRLPLLTVTGVLILGVAILFGIRDTLPWAVAEQLGTDAGMSVTEVGNLFSLMYAVSILGPMGLIVLARFIAPKHLLAVSMTVTGLFAWMFTVSDGNAMQFSVGIVAWATIYFMAFAQLNAVAAIIDPQGRLVSGVGSGFIGGVMIAPLLGGILIDASGYTPLAVAELGLSVVIIVFVYAALARGR